MIYVKKDWMHATSDEPSTLQGFRTTTLRTEFHSSETRGSGRVTAPFLSTWKLPGPMGPSAVALVAVLGTASLVHAQVTHDTTSTTPTRSRPAAGIRFDTHPGWSVGLEGYTGMGTLFTSEGTKGHVIAGGVSRLRISYVEAGGVLEISDESTERWRSIGGFLGAYLPFISWVDVDATLGLVMRNYISTDTRYGSSGVTVGVPALTLRVGVSDRPFNSQLGLRLGAALLFGLDLKHREVSWAYELTKDATLEGTTRFGGFTAGMVISLGFDVAQHGSS